MEKKEGGKKMDSQTSWTQVAKSGQMKATSTSAATSATSTSGSSFAGAAAGGVWVSSGAVGGGAWGSSGAAGRGAWGSSGAAGGGAWQSFETNQWSSLPVPPVWSSRTTYRSVPQRPEPETRKPSKTNERSSRPKPLNPSPNYYKECSPVPEVQQTSAFPSVWSPSTARKVTKKNLQINLLIFLFF